MAANPIAALDTLLVAPRKFGELVVWPLTLQRLAALDILGSPFMQDKSAWATTDIVALAWAATRPAEDIGRVCSATRAEVMSEALEWAAKRKTAKQLKKHLNSIALECKRQMSLLVRLVPESRQEDASSTTVQKTSGTKTNNGWLTALFHTAVVDFKMSAEDALAKVPVVQLVLLKRQQAYIDAEGKAMTLEDKEMMDKIGQRNG